MNALDAAIAKINANADASAATARRIDTDSRVVFLAAICAANTFEITGHGKAGFEQVVAHAHSEMAARCRRAGILLRARRSKLFNGCRIGARLSEAAAARRAEMARYVEASERNLAGVDAALFLIVANPLPLTVGGL